MSQPDPDGTRRPRLMPPAEEAAATEMADWIGRQLDEDERIAREAIHGPDDDGVWKRTDRPSAGYLTDDDVEFDDTEIERDTCRIEGKGITIYDEGGHSKEQAEHIVRHDPARELRRVEAHRLLLAAHARRVHRCVAGEITVDDEDCPIKVALAAPYFDQPGYRQEWRR